MRVRLVGGSNKAEGRVEILIGGEWGTACDHNWDLREAHVVCRMLGYQEAIRAVGSGYFGSGTGDIVLHGTRCSGNETNIAQCSNFFPHGLHPLRRRRCHLLTRYGYLKCVVKWIA